MSQRDDIIAKRKKYCVDTTFVDPALVVESGKGCYIFDADGKRYLDFNSSCVTNPLGYNVPEINDAIIECVLKGAYKIAGQDFDSKEHADLAEKLLSTMPASLNKAMLVCTGTEAVENAIKLSYRQRSHSLGVKPNSLFGISCEGAFHGRTLGSLSHNASKPIHRKGYPKIAVEKIKFCEDDNDDHVKDIWNYHPEEVAYVLTEAVQGEGGYKFASQRFIDELRSYTRMYGIPLIIDEVQAGMGRTGKWWAFQHYGIEPEFVTVAKGLQVGAIVMKETYDPKEHSAISSTWGGGHRLDMIAGLKTIEIIQRDKLMENAERMGEHVKDQTREWMTMYPDVITDVRGLGLMIGVDFTSKEQRDAVEKSAYYDGLLLLGCGEKSIRIAPPLNITESEIDKGLEIFERQIMKL